MNPAIERLKDMPREMTADQAAFVLDRSHDFIIRSVNRKDGQGIEHRRDSGRGTGANGRYIITQEALLVFIVRSTGGDRLTLMQAIDELLPKRLRELAHQIASAPAREGALPENVIPMKRKRAAHADRFANHPDFFKTA